MTAVAPTSNLRVRAESTALILIDVQERLAGAMTVEDFDAVTRNLLVLIAAAQRFHLPVAVSEQYPAGLGRTVPVLAEALGQLSPPAVYFDKLAFSIADEPMFQSFLGAGRRSLIVTGMETHVCVYQSVRDLVERGYSVHVPVDAVISRRPTNKQVGLALIERAGGIATSTEVLLFDLLERAGSDDFRALAKLVK